jgi:hypothetical protein
MSTTDPASAYALAMQRLIDRYTQANANLDQQDAARRAATTQTLNTLDQNLPDQFTHTYAALADRGLLQSGIGLNDVSLINQRYLSQRADAQNKQDAALAKSAQQRMQNNADLEYQKANLERVDIFGQPITPATSASTNVAAPASAPKPPVSPQVSQTAPAAPPRASNSDLLASAAKSMGA